METTKQTFGDFLKKARTDRRLPRRSLASLVGCSCTHIANIERNASPRPTSEFIEKLALTLGGDVGEWISMASTVRTRSRQRDARIVLTGERLLDNFRVNVVAAMKHRDIGFDGLIGFQSGEVSHWLTASSPRLAAIDRVATALGVSASSLLLSPEEFARQLDACPAGGCQ